MIHDVSTDPDAPPQFLLLVGERERCRNGVAYSGLVGDAHRRRYPDLQPLLIEQAPLDVFYAAYDLVIARQWHLANARKWRMAGSEQIEGRIECTAATRILRFKDDVVIRLFARGDEHQHTRLDMRSASRIGKSDLGANAKRIRQFLSDLKTRLKSNT
jgi:Protein of unknown function (DUF1499)